jgi:acetolactate synthase-1/2/3 large subunit
MPIRNFRADLPVASEVGPALEALAAVMGPVSGDRRPTVEARRQRVGQRIQDLRARAQTSALAGRSTPMTKAWVGHCLAQATKGMGATILHELGCPFSVLDLRDHGSWYLEPLSGGLGWGLPAAIGIKLADPERLVVATMGDGSYIFANPVACHQVIEHYELPILTIVLNNAEWGTVERSVLGLYPQGYAAKANEMPLVGLDPSPNFVKIAEASRAYAERVNDGVQLPEAIARALDVVKKEKRQALLEVSVK